MRERAKTNLDKQAQEILRIASECGAQSDYFFVTTFKRYQRQLKILDSLEKSLDEYGMTVTKEYVKGRQNLCSNPAIADYNRTTDSANKTVATLMRILKNYGADDSNADEDPLADAISGGEGNE